MTQINGSAWIFDISSKNIRGNPSDPSDPSSK